MAAKFLIFCWSGISINTVVKFQFHHSQFYYLIKIKIWNSWVDWENSRIVRNVNNNKIKECSECLNKTCAYTCKCRTSWQRSFRILSACHFHKPTNKGHFNGSVSFVHICWILWILLGIENNIEHIQYLKKVLEKV